MERRDVGRERFELERGGDGQRLDKGPSVAEGQRRQRGGERAVVDQRKSFLGLERHVAKQGVGEVGERRQIRRAGGAQQAYLGNLAVVERVDDALGEQRTHADGAL